MKVVLSVWRRIVQTPQKEEKVVRIRVEKTLSYHQIRRILSEEAIERELPWHFKKGESYHVLSYGDVDSLTWLRLLVKQQHIRYGFVTTWAMAETDAKEMALWLDKGYIDRLDFYVGDIVFNTRDKVKAVLYSAGKKHGCKVALLKNHSKIAVVFGDHFDAVVESSANLNTNPRIEQTCITIDSNLARWYKSFFDEFNPFNVDYQQPPNFKLEDEIDGQTASNNGE